MNPEQNQQPSQNQQPQPAQVSPQIQQPGVSPAPQKKRSKKLALALLLGPTILLLLTLALYALSNLIASSAQPTQGSGALFENVSPLGTTINILLFLFGTVGVLTWLPGIIIGAILLSKK